MYEFLKIIHFLSFSVAIGAGVANQLVGLRMASIPPAAMPQIGAIRLSFGAASTIGLVLLWFTGLLLISTSVGTGVFANPMFHVKMTAVLVLTILSVIANVTVSRAKAAGTPPDAKRMKFLGQASLAVAVLTVILAVLTFG